MIEKEQCFLNNYSKVNGVAHAKRVLEILKANNIEIPYGASAEVQHIIESVNSINLYKLIKKSNEQLDVQKESLKEMVENSKKQKRQFIIATVISVIALTFSLGLKDIIMNFLETI